LRFSVIRFVQAVDWCFTGVALVMALAPVIYSFILHRKDI